MPKNRNIVEAIRTMMGSPNGSDDEDLSKTKSSEKTSTPKRRGEDVTSSASKRKAIDAEIVVARTNSGIGIDEKLSLLKVNVSK